MQSVTRGVGGPGGDGEGSPGACADTFWNTDELRRPAAILTNPMLPAKLGYMRSFECEHGIIRLMQTCHMTYDKHQYTRVTPSASSMRAPRGRVAGGGVSLGEMEIQQLSATGLTGCLAELQMRGNAVDAEWCSTFRLLAVTCTCDPGVRNISLMRVSYAMMDLAMAARCCSHVNIELTR